MILSQPDIRKEVDKGNIVFDPPLEKRQWGEASIDLRLSSKFTKLIPSKGVTFNLAEGLAALASTGLWKEHTFPEKDEFGKTNRYILEPDEFVLALTHEKITIPNHLIGLVEGRSTYARVGLTMHQTAPWIQPGWTGHITLEIRNSGPLNIALTPILDMPCQLTFLPLTTALGQDMAYGARESDAYQDQESAMPPLNKPATD